MERPHRTSRAETNDVLVNLLEDRTDSTLEKEARKVPVLHGRPMECRKTLKSHFAKVHGISWGKDSRTLVSASWDGKILIWDAYTGKKDRIISSKSNWMMSCDISPLRRLVIAGGLDCMCTVYRLTDNPNQRGIQQCLEHDNSLACCQFMDEGKILTSSGDGIAYMWDIATSTAITEFKGHTDYLLCQAISPDKSLLVTAGFDQTAKLWDIRSKKCAHTFFGHSKEINDVAFFPSGMAFATASEDHTCCLFDLRSNQQLMKYKSDVVKSPVSNLVFSLSGRLLFTGYEDSEIRLWDALKGTFVGVLRGHASMITRLAVTPDGKGLASSSFDTTIKIWN